MQGLSRSCSASFVRRQRRVPRERRGAAVVELAVLAPVLFLLIFGLIEYGRMVMVQQLLTNAAREGARVGILEYDNDTDRDNAITTAVNNYLATIEAEDPGISLVDVDGDGTDDAVEVTVSVGFDQVSWMPAPLWLGGHTLSNKATMRLESP